MATGLRSVDDVLHLDRRWFRLRPERRHRCRRPDHSELDLYDGGRGGRLVIAIRHLGRGRLLYQPLILDGALPSVERSAAALFILAASRAEPIPVITAEEWLQLRRLLAVRGAIGRRGPAKRDPVKAR